MRGISGEYGLLLNYDIISNLEITDEQLSFDLSFEILGFEDTKMHLELNYVPDYETTTAKFDSLKISELNFMGIEIELNAYLRDFD